MLKVHVSFCRGEQRKGIAFNIEFLIWRSVTVTVMVTVTINKIQGHKLYSGDTDSIFLIKLRAW